MITTYNDCQHKQKRAKAELARVNKELRQLHTQVAALEAERDKLLAELDDSAPGNLGVEIGRSAGTQCQSEEWASDPIVLGPIGLPRVRDHHGAGERGTTHGHASEDRRHQVAADSGRGPDQEADLRPDRSVPVA